MNWNLIRRNVIRWVRRYRLILMVSGVMAAVFAVAMMIPSGVHGGIHLTIQPAPKSGDYGDFLDALGWRESTNNYAAVNRFGYMGRYQMGGSALREAGFKDENGTWTAKAHSYGVYDSDDFLHSPEAQNAAIAAYHTKVCQYIRADRLDRYIGSTYCGVTVTRSGLLASCHLVGIGSMKKALASGTHAYDGNNTPASEYMERFGGFDISQVWGE